MLYFFLNDIIVLFAVHIEDLLQFIGGIVGEFNIFIKSGFQAGIAVDEFLHGRGVAGDDDDQVIPVVFHGFQDRVDRFLAEGILLIGGQGIGFIDEEDTAHGRFDLLLGLESCLSDKAGYQSGTVGFHQLSFGQDSDLLIKPADNSGNGRLAGPGIAGKDQMQGYRDRLQALVLTHLLDLDKIHQFLDIRFDRFKADQLVQLLHGILLRFLRRFRFRSAVGTAGPGRDGQLLIHILQEIFGFGQGVLGVFDRVILGQCRLFGRRLGFVGHGAAGGAGIVFPAVRPVPGRTAAGPFAGAAPGRTPVRASSAAAGRCAEHIIIKTSQ